MSYSIVYAIPTANADLATERLARWKARGYGTAVLANGPAYQAAVGNADRVFRCETYPGWARSVNILCSNLTADIVITGGDDMDPDPKADPQQVAREFVEHFGGLYGVMQPTGDRWGENESATSPSGPVSERICGSPWMGREFYTRWNGGLGPLWPAYVHNFADEELCETLKLHGLLWQRRDLTHHHDHWLRTGRRMPDYMRAPMAAWDRDQKLLRQRKRTGFPGHDPLTYTMSRS